MADSPTPRSYRIPPLTVEGGQADPLREELRDIVSLILDIKVTLRSLRTDLEELKSLEEQQVTKKPSLFPQSVRGAVTPKRALIAAMIALLTALPEILEQLQHALEKLPK
jgi:hypothetical protein